MSYGAFSTRSSRYAFAVGLGHQMRLFGALLALAAAAGCQGLGTDPAQRWSSLPHAMGCQPDPVTFPDGPDVARIRQMSFSHAGEQSLRLDVEFELAGLAPPEEPRVIRTQSGIIAAPGSISMSFLVQPKGLGADEVIVIESPSPSVNGGWRADTSTFNSSNPDILKSVSTRENIRSFVLDLSVLDRQLGTSPFQADVSVVTMVSGQPGYMGLANLFPVRGSDCYWETPTSTAVQPDRRSPVSQSAPLATSPSEPVTAATITPPMALFEGADTHGFTDHPDVRCDDDDRAAMVMRTTQSLVVVCRRKSGALYYKGMRLSDSAAIRLEGAVSSPDGYAVTNPSDGTRYELTKRGLVIVIGGQVAASEDAVESAFL